MSVFSSVLLVEDERDLAIALQIALRKLGVEAIHASTMGQARDLISGSEGFELVVLDRNLPDGDGIDLCAELRAQGFTGRILMLTAVGGISDRVLGLNQGADDYLPKPFSWEELEARIRALSRRGAASTPAVREPANPALKDWKLDEARLRIHGPRGDWVVLTPLEFKLASCLIESSGTIVSRDRLLKDVWGFTLLPRTRTVDHFLGRLRKHFEENPETPKHFLTVRGAGYRFEP